MSTEKKETAAAAEETAEEVKTEEAAPKTEKKEKKPKKESKKETKKEVDAAAAVEAAVREEKEKYLRLMAEYDNFRKRSRAERDALYADIKADTVAKFLPVFDNLERALKQETADEAYRKGVEMIMNQFNATLEKLGAAKMECEGQKFDPELHNAVMHVEDESLGENEIVEVFQKGFTMGDKVIRFAMVKVAN